MPSISTELAYTVQVDAADLVAAIEIDVEYRPIAETLRLCNIFGGSAPITTIPTELVDLIEEFLTVHKHEAIAQRQSEVKELRDCAERRCLKFDHISDERKVIHVNKVLAERKERLLESLDDVDREELRDFVVIHCLLVNYDQQEDKYDHDDNVTEWEELVGKLGEQECGMFSGGNKYDRFIRDNYGLDVFIAHTADEGADLECTTLAYLRLPDGRDRHQSHKRDQFRPDPEIFDLHTPAEAEIRLARQIWPPIEPSKEEKARFLRILTELAMPDQELDGNDESSEHLHARAEPRLTVLTSIDVERCNMKRGTCRGRSD
ncbi:hypothetical protein LTR15_005302 [Elasticomyces elasticus]|nr:hypothetical protein LTR15_005302 [Elasticomyces elasticus]